MEIIGFVLAAIGALFTIALFVKGSDEFGTGLPYVAILFILTGPAMAGIDGLLIRLATLGVIAVFGGFMLLDFE